MCDVPDPVVTPPQIRVDRNAEQSARVKLKKNKGNKTGLQQLRGPATGPMSISDLLGGLTIGSRS